MAFVDEIQLHIIAGKGGDGVVRWRHEKGKPKSGPGGGNGGRGGDVRVIAVRDLGYLDTYRHVKNLCAEDGVDGESDGCEGKNGDVLIVKVPVGSIVTNLSTDEVIELNKEGEEKLILRGGRNGMGNEHFKNSRNVSPTESTLGTLGEESNFLIELRLIADIGLVGLPSAGKSSLLNALTNARSKVAEYHFTTLEPYLGVLGNGAVIADIPGIIEGANEGRGLGAKFLRHIERTHILAHIISCESGDTNTIVKDYNTIRNELTKYGRGLSDKKEIIVLSKVDMIDDIKRNDIITKLTDEVGNTVIPVSVYDDVLIKKLHDAFVKLI